MKTLFICLLLTCSAPAFAQTAPVIEAAQPFEDATTIVIHSKDSPETAYQNALAGILTAGYGLDKARFYIVGRADKLR